MHFSLIITSILFSSVLVDVIFSRICARDCECDCDNDRSTLNCSSLGISNVTVCGSLYHMKEVDLTYNNLTGLLAVPLSGCWFDFSHNIISSVRVRRTSVTRCPAFLLDLSHNALKRLSRRAVHLRPYGTLHAFVVIDLSHNEIEYLEHGSIEVPCTIERCTDVPTENITVDLSFNKLFTVHPTAVTISLSVPTDIYLLINNNNIRNFSISSFVNVDNPFRSCLINFRNNNISGLLEGDIENVGSGNLSLILDENPWNCDCGQRYVSSNTSRLRYFLSSLDSSVQPICDRPSLAKMRPLLSLSESEFRCPPMLDPNAVLDIHVSEGDNLTLLCPVMGADPPVTYVDWQFFKGNSIEQGEKASFHVRKCLNCSLEIRNVRKDAEGVYQCTVSNGEIKTIKQLVVVDIASYICNKSYNQTSGSNNKLLTRITMILLAIFLIIAVIYSIAVTFKLKKQKRYKPPLNVKHGRSETSFQTVRYDVTTANQTFDKESYDYTDPPNARIQSDHGKVQDIYDNEDCYENYRVCRN